MKLSITKIFLIFIVVLALWAAVSYAAYFYFQDWAVLGQFGSLFGAVNALFAGLAFAGVVTTLLLQMKEIDATRKEVSITAELLHKQTTILASQARFLELQEGVQYRQLQTSGNQLRAEILQFMWQAEKSKLEGVEDSNQEKVIRQNMKLYEDKINSIFSSPSG